MSKLFLSVNIGKIAVIQNHKKKLLSSTHANIQ